MKREYPLVMAAVGDEDALVGFRLAGQLDGDGVVAVAHVGGGVGGRVGHALPVDEARAVLGRALLGRRAAGAAESVFEGQDVVSCAASIHQCSIISLSFSGSDFGEVVALGEVLVEVIELPLVVVEGGCRAHGR